MDPAGTDTPDSRQAASLLAMLGVIELAVLMPAVILCLLVIRPSESFERQAMARLTAGQWAWARETAPMAGPVLALLGLAPAGAYLALRRLVRRRRKPAVLAVRFLLLVQLIELIFLAVQRAPAAAESFRDGQPVHVTVNVLAVGTPLVLVGYIFWRLGGLTQPGGEL